MAESSTTVTAATTTAATKFDYLLNCGFENLKICHHPDIVVKQAYSFTSLKYSKEWNKSNTMLPEAAVRYRWSLVRTMLVNEGMTPMVRDWYALLPTEIQELPVSRHEYYYDETLIDHFNMNFQFPSLEEHYRTVLENMKLEPVKVIKTNTDLCQELLSRGFRVNSIYGAVPTLHYRLYLAAVVDPLPKNELVVSLIDSGITPASRTWPTFYEFLRNKVTFRGLYREHIIERQPAESTVSSNDKTQDKKLSWKDKHPTHPRQDYNRTYLGKRRSFMGNHMNSLRSTEEDEAVDDLHEEPKPNQDLEVNLSLLQSKVNALQMENQSLKNRVTEIDTARQPDRHQDPQQHLLLQQIASQMNSLLQQSQTGRSASNFTFGGGGNPGSPRKRSKMNSNKPMDRYQGGGSSTKMNIYGPGGGGQPGKPSKKSDDHIDRYLHNPSGPEPWKRWLRVCNNCGRHGGHFGKRCKGQRRYNWTPSEDPRLVQPIEPYPANRQAALERCREEIRLYGTTGVRWNCTPNEAPTPAELL
jgi:hypothetical protein